MSGAETESAPLDLVASVFGEMHMDTLNSAGLGARRNEDIALDLMKFVAGTAGVGKAAWPRLDLPERAEPSRRST